MQIETIKFGLAAQAFSEICKAIESDAVDPTNPQVQVIFRDMAENLRTNADDCFMLKAQLEEAMARCKGLIAGLQAKQKSLAHALDNLYDAVQPHVTSNIKCNSGTLYIQQKLASEIYLPLGYDNRLEMDTIKAKKIDARFVKQKISYQLDKKEVEAFLKVGQTLDWAKLVEKKTLVMRGVKKDDGLSDSQRD